MTEKIYLTQRIKEILTEMGFGPKEKIALFLGDKFSKDEIYVTNTTGAFEGEATSASLDNIFHVDKVLGAVINANRPFRERNLRDKYVLFASHSHPRNIGEVVNPGYIGWSVDDVPSDYENLRGRVVQIKDLNGNQIYFTLKSVSNGKDGDDRFMEGVAGRKRLKEFHFFICPTSNIARKKFTGEVAVDCYKYDPQGIGKIRKVEIAQQLLTTKYLQKTLLDPQKVVIVETEKDTGNLVLPYKGK